MNKFLYKLPFISLASLSTGFGFADIQVENHSGYDIRVSMLGEACRIFDGDRYAYAPCEEKNLSQNECLNFSDFPKRTRSERPYVVVPRIIFSSFGFSYSCRLSVHSLANAELPNAHLSTSSKKPEFALLHLHAATLLVEKDYHLFIHENYGYFPQPYIDCSLFATPVPLINQSWHAVEKHASCPALPSTKVSSIR